MNIKQVVAAIAVVVESDPQPLDLHLEMAVPLVQVLSVTNPNTAALKHVLFLIERKEGNVLFNDALITFYLRLYGVGHIVEDHSDSERGKSAAATWATVSD